VVSRKRLYARAGVLPAPTSLMAAEAHHQYQRFLARRWLERRAHRMILGFAGT
jgi:hypothetical protein